VCTGVLAPGGPPAWLMRSRYSGAVIAVTGPISATLLPPAVPPPLAPSVNSQALSQASFHFSLGSALACLLTATSLAHERRAQ
jgi:hypothetical protein